MRRTKQTETHGRKSAQLLAVSILLAAPSEVLAGAWTLKQGQGLVIATLEGVRSNERFDEDGRRVGASVFRKAEIHVLAEYGVSERFTLRGKGTSERWCVEPPHDSCRSGLGTQEIGGRLRVFEQDGVVASLEASLRVDAAHRALGYEARLLGGYSFEIASLPVFVDAQAGWRHGAGPEGNEALLDLTFGARPVPELMFLLQSFSTLSMANDPAWEVVSERSTLQASAVWDMNEAFSVQFGVRRTILGRDALSEWGLLSAVWWRF